ncbi:MAG: LytTR family DNA-binding domain-containing protein [Gammaproteobacteria bacterium]|jgi:DNA-binding LytR/AlgR family response regulator|nr:LytTR family DNA-binding domain-containing protein [Gammaproteobacteria bacterium]MBU0891727.1 LytTR family DNA-binding domain-containing protein [Gammaproteobacteria bacterium]
MTSPQPRALIAEDEPLLAAALQQELAQAWPALRIAATVGDGLSAVQRALALQPDVLFFDIRMPGQSGLDAAAELADAWPVDKPFPALVFVTAYDQYAVQAFEAQAVDYLLKPVQGPRLQKTVQKLQLALSSQPSAAINLEANLEATIAQLRHLLAAPGVASATPAAAAPPAGTAPLTMIQASSGSQILMVPVAEVLYFEAADKYVRVLTATREFLIRTPLKDLTAQLDPQVFWQVHRSTLVRAGSITTVTRDEAGKLHLEVAGRPEKLLVSRLYAHLFKAM